MNAMPARKLEEEERNAPEVEAAYEAVPEEQIAEVIDGELHVQPRPRLTHSLATTQITTELSSFGRRSGVPGGWVILFEPEIHFGPRPDKLQPDLAGWRRERMPEVPNEGACVIVPDWVCEVLSPSTQFRDRSKKMTIYRREGVGHVWLVDPAAQVVEVYRLIAQGFLQIGVYGGDVRERLEPFEAIEIDLGALWAR